MSIITKNGTVIDVPKTERKFCLAKLHMPHMGFKNTSQTARSIYYWPRICSDIANLTSSCKACLEDNPSRQKEPEKENNVVPLDEMEPMDQVSADLLNLYGKDYIILVDRASSYPWVRKIRNQSAAELDSKEDEKFLAGRYPNSLRTDGANNFVGGLGNFTNFLLHISLKEMVWRRDMCLKQNLL